MLTNADLRVLLNYFCILWIFILIPSILLFSLAKILKRHRSYFEEKTALSDGANDAEVSNYFCLAN